MNKRCPKCGKTKPTNDFYEKKNYRWKSERYHAYCKSCVRSRTHDFYIKNAVELRKREKARRERLGDSLRLQKREHRRKCREEVFVGYGGKCVCCGETEFKFLAIDHINGGGQKHLKSIGGATNLVYWLKKNGFPKGFQILCHNCNLAKGFYGACPHKTK